MADDALGRKGVLGSVDVRGEHDTVVVDFAYGWTDDSYAGGSARLDGAVEKTRVLIPSDEPINAKTWTVVENK